MKTISIKVVGIAAVLLLLCPSKGYFILLCGLCFHIRPFWNARILSL